MGALILCAFAHAHKGALRVLEIKKKEDRHLFGAERGLELRGRSPSRPKPHPSPYDAQGASLRLASLFYALRAS